MRLKIYFRVFPLLHNSSQFSEQICIYIEPKSQFLPIKALYCTIFCEGWPKQAPIKVSLNTFFMCTKQNLKHTCTIQNKFCSFFFVSFFFKCNQQYLQTPCRLSHVVSLDFQPKKEITSQVESDVHLFFFSFQKRENISVFFFCMGMTTLMLSNTYVKTLVCCPFQQNEMKHEHLHLLLRCKSSSHT